MPVVPGTVLEYQITGLSALDIVGGKLAGQVVVNPSGTTTITIPIAADSTSEGIEKLTLWINGQSASMDVLDTSTTPIMTTESHQLTVLVDKGVLSPQPVLLKDLVEKLKLINGIVQSHSITYGNTSFEYDQVDALITTVIRDNNFTAEFSKEILDVAPSAANLSYKDAVALVGVSNIETVIINIAGADGFYVQ